MSRQRAITTATCVQPQLTFSTVIRPEVRATGVNLQDTSRGSGRRGARSGAALLGVAVLGLTACTASPSGSPPDPTSLDGVVQDLAELRGPNGLIRMPEANDGPVSDLYPTALFLESAGEYVTDGLDTPGVLEQGLKDPQRVDALTLWSAVEIQASVGGAPTAELRQAVSAAAMPAPQEGADAEIGALWLWSDLIRSAEALGLGPVPGAEQARTRLSAVVLDDISTSPYLLWRLFDAHTALDVSPSPRLVERLAGLEVVELPREYESILDVQGVLEAASARGTDAALPGGMTDHLSGLVQGGSLREDVLINSALRSLDLLGATSERSTLREDVLAARIDDSNGLIAPAGASNGSVQGTYLAARLADGSFSEIATADTVSALERILEADEADPVPRLQALVALKRAQQSDWQKYDAVATEAVESAPTSVDAAGLRAYLVLVEPLMQLEPDVPLATLVEFPVDTANVDSAAAGLAAISNAAYFANADEVRTMFPELQALIPELVSVPAEPAVLYYRALTAMTSAGLSGLGSEDFDRAAATLAEYRGCSAQDSLFRVGFEPDAPCSLAVSTLMLGVPGAYTLGGNE